MPKIHDWIVVNAQTYPYFLHCKRCGIKQPFLMPMAVDVFVAMSDAFVKLHKNCAERKEDDRSM